MLMSSSYQEIGYQVISIAVVKNNTNFITNIF